MIVDKVIVALEARIANYKANMIEADRVSDRTFKNISKLADRAKQRFGASFASAFSVGAVVALGAAFVNLADRANQLQASLRLATSGFGNLGQAQEDVRRIAMATATPLEDVGKLYGTIMRSANELGITQAEAARATETISKAFLVFGADATTAAQGTRQLIQALQSGALRGDEFNTMMEAAPGLARLLADSLQKPVTQLRAMAEQGLLTGDIMLKAFTKPSAALEELDKRAANMPMTFDRAMTQVYNAAMITFSAFDRGGEFSQMLSDFVTGGADDLANLEQRAEIMGGNLRSTISALNNVFDPIGDNAISVMDIIEGEIIGLRNLISDLLGMIDSVRNAVPNAANAMRAGLRQNFITRRFTGPDTPPHSTLQRDFDARAAAGDRKAMMDRLWRNTFAMLGDPNARGTKALPKKKGPKGKSAEQLEKERLQELEKQFQIESKLRDLSQSLVDARAAQLVAADDVYKARVQQLEFARDEAILGYENDVIQKRMTADQAERASVLQRQITAEKIRLLDLEREEKSRKAAVEIQAAALQNEIDLVSAQAKALDTREMQRDAALEILKLQYELQRLQLEDIIASRTATEAQKKIAQARLDILNGLERREVAEVEKQYRSPGEEYLGELEKQAANIQDELEGLAIDKVKDLSSAFGDATAKALGLSGAIGDLVSQLIRMAFQQAIVLPLMRAIFGAAGSFGGGPKRTPDIYGTDLDWLTGLGRAGGGPVRAGRTYLVGEKGPELVKMPSNGTVVPNHEVRQAMAGGGGTGIVEVRIAAGEYFDARVASISGPVAAKIVTLATPKVTDYSAAKTASKLTRPHL